MRSFLAAAMSAICAQACASAYQSTLAATASGDKPSPKVSFNDKRAKATGQEARLSGIRLSRAHAQALFSRVDDLVQSRFYNTDSVKKSWMPQYQTACKQLSASNDLSMQELSAIINRTLKSLGTSHCQFVTCEDESFYFLHSLFASLHGAKARSDDAVKKIYGPGLVTGGPGFEANVVRYVLDESAAARAGVEIGDTILKVNGVPYSFYSQLLARNKETPVKLTLHKDGTAAGQTSLAELHADAQELYPAYVEAIKASEKIISKDKLSLGYIHLWSGGTPSAEAVNEIISDKMRTVDGLILDLRDGYGGASLNDLDIFFRPKIAYPDLVGKGRDGKEFGERLYFDKPMVLLINGGARSGKELLAWSLKRSGRARLVGETTAGAVVAGSLFNIDKQTSLYLAVADIQLRLSEPPTDGKAAPEPVSERLEGRGVAPDIVILNEGHNQNGYGLQLKGAIEALEKLIGGQN